MCVKFPPRDLNPDPCPPHPINTYIYGVTITLRTCSGYLDYFYFFDWSSFFGIEKHIYRFVVGLSSWMDFLVASSLAFVLIKIFITIKHDYNMSSETIFGNSNFILLFF